MNDHDVSHEQDNKQAHIHGEHKQKDKEKDKHKKDKSKPQVEFVVSEPTSFKAVE
jgi:hypothetical protein